MHKSLLVFIACSFSLIYGNPAISQALYLLEKNQVDNYISSDGNLTTDTYWALRINDLKTGLITDPDDSPFQVLYTRKQKQGTSGNYVSTTSFYSFDNEMYEIDGKLYNLGYDYLNQTDITFEIDLNDFSYKINPQPMPTEWNFSASTHDRVVAGKQVSRSAKFTQMGVEINGANLVSRNLDGSISIGSYSIKFGDEANGDQSMWATDANGIVDINIINGTDLKINGISIQGQINANQNTILDNTKNIDSNRNNIDLNAKSIAENKSNITANAQSIENNKRSIDYSGRRIDQNSREIQSNRQNINDLGFGVAGATALSTAMTALPTVSEDSPLFCGVGTGGYSSRYAMSVGCAVKASERLSFNAGGSYVFGGGADYGNGSLSNVAGRAGFVFKFGEIQSSPKGDLQARVKELESANQVIQEENAAIREQNAAMQSANKELMARLERLEAIASSVLQQNSVASK